MGLMDLFSSSGRSDRALKKHVLRAKNKDSQSADRFVSLEALRDIASDEDSSAEEFSEAVLGLLGRFTIRYDKTIEDEQEKEWVFSELVELKDRLLPELTRHLRNADSIAWGLKLLGDVASLEQQWPILEDLCQRNDNNYTRDPAKKIQLVDYLGDSHDPRTGSALLPYLEDMDETVRFATAEALFRHRTRSSDAEVPGAKDALLAVLTSPKEESRRIKRRIVDGFADLGWDVKGFAGTVEKLLGDLLPGARLDGQSKIKRITK